MAKKDQVVDIPEKDENISEIDVSAEMRGSFLEYAVSVIYARALPDARDGLKPVQRAPRPALQFAGPPGRWPR